MKKWALTIPTLLLGYILLLGVYHVLRGVGVEDQFAGKKNIVPVLIIGGGPAAFAAAVYTARAKFETTVFAGEKPGGQLTNVHQIETWLGKQKSTGQEAINDLIEQAKHFGVVVVPENIVALDLSSKEAPFPVKTNDGTILNALSIIIATGRIPKKLDVPGVEKYWAKGGVGSCTLCDAPFHKGQDVAVIGGGDTAADHALQLAAYADNVYMIVRDTKLDATAAVQEYLQNNKNIHILFDTQLKEIRGDGNHVTGVVVENTKDKKITELPLKGVYFAIGYNPNSSLVKSFLKTDSKGFITLRGRTQMTSIPGVFAAGDVTDPRYGKVATALGSGAQAGIDAIEFLQNEGFNQEIAEKFRDSFFNTSFNASSQKEQSRNSIKQLQTEQELDAFLAEHSLVALKFYTDFCPTCKTIDKQLETASIDNKITLAEINTEKAPELAKKFNISSVPYVIIMQNATKVAEEKIKDFQQLMQLLKKYTQAN